MKLDKEIEALFSFEYSYLYAWSRYHPIDGLDSLFDTVSENTLAVRPDRVRGVRGTHLTGTANQNFYYLLLN
jgi:hypothetical protein